MRYYTGEEEYCLPGAMTREMKRKIIRKEQEQYRLDLMEREADDQTEYNKTDPDDTKEPVTSEQLQTGMRVKMKDLGCICKKDYKNVTVPMLMSFGKIVTINQVYRDSFSIKGDGDEAKYAYSPSWIDCIISRPAEQAAKTRKDPVTIDQLQIGTKVMLKKFAECTESRLMTSSLVDAFKDHENQIRTISKMDAGCFKIEEDKYGYWFDYSWVSHIVSQPEEKPEPTIPPTWIVPGMVVRLEDGNKCYIKWISDNGDIRLVKYDYSHSQAMVRDIVEIIATTKDSPLIWKGGEDDGK